MFTLPDANDAATTCPPFKGVGPKPSGFWQDCDPDTNFAGTIPIADYFNELIVNLRALLVRAGVAGVKGDQTMLWRAIEQRIHALDIPQVPQQFFQIDSSVTIHVAPGGSPTPANPLGGQPFDTLASAWEWLGFYSITPNGSVTIQLATATYNHAAQLALNHPNGDRITILGGDLYSTVLYFYNSSNGLAIAGNLAMLSNVTVLGVKAGGTTGISVTGSVTVYAVVAQGFDVAVNVQGTGFLLFGALYVNDTLTGGLSVNQGAVVNGGTLSCTNIGFHIGAPFFTAGCAATTGGTIWLDSLSVLNCYQGARISGAGSELRVRAINIATIESPVAVECNDGAVIISNSNTPGDWHADAPGYFNADYWGFIRANNAFDASTKALASPPATSGGVIGNVNSMIVTS